MSDSLIETEVPPNPFRDFLLGIVPHMQKVAGEYENVGRFYGEKAIKELRSISIDAGRQNGKTRGIKEFMRQHAKNTGQTMLFVDWFHKESLFTRKDEDKSFGLFPSELGSVQDPKKVVDYYLQNKYVVLVLSGAPDWHQQVLKELGQRYLDDRDIFPAGFIVILDK